MKLFESLKAATLPAFDVADDLTKIPASTLSKIRGGGLTALSVLVGENTDSIDNIHALVNIMFEKHVNLNNIDYTRIVPTIKDYKLRRHKRQSPFQYLSHRH